LDLRTWSPLSWSLKQRQQDWLLLAVLELAVPERELKLEPELELMAVQRKDRLRPDFQQLLNSNHQLRQGLGPTCVHAQPEQPWRSLRHSALRSLVAEHQRRGSRLQQAHMDRLGRVVEENMLLLAQRHKLAPA
jgi:hypothetical protein